MGGWRFFIQGRRTKTETRSQCMKVLVSRAGNDGSIASNALVMCRDGAVDLSIWLAMPEMGSG
jgi:hypothetical protein